MRSSKPLHYPPQTLEPFPAFPRWRRAWTRVKHPSTTRAWTSAVDNEALAIELARSGIKVPCDPRSVAYEGAWHDGLNGLWCSRAESQRQYGFDDDGMPMRPDQFRAYLLSLPQNDVGQRWRNRAMWCTVKGEHAHALFPLALAAGGDVRSSSEERMTPRPDNVLEWLLARAEGDISSRAAQTVALGSTLNHASDHMELGVRKHSLSTLRRLMDLGLTLDAPKRAAKWFRPYVSDPSISHVDEVREAQACCQALLDAGANPNARNADGHTPLMILLGTQRCGNDPRLQDHLESWFEFWVARGADLSATSKEGNSLLHVALGAPFGPGLPLSIFDALRAANPGAMDVPYRDEYPFSAAAGKTPAEVLRHTARDDLHLTSSWNGVEAAAERLLSRIDAELLAAAVQDTLDATVEGTPGEPTAARQPRRRL